jgi:scyllo-inositol 2-dehydrogenase (NADP+)
MVDAAKKVALVGYGFASRTFHAPSLVITPGLHLTKVVSSDRAKVLADLQAVEVVPKFDEALADPEIELVVIATPNQSHFPLAQAALQARKHVVVDKPFTITSQDAAELIRLAAEKERVLSVYQSRRWDGDFLTIKALLAGGLLGDIYSCEIRYDRFRPDVKVRWREQDLPGSGILYDLGAHLIDQAVQLFGLPKAITADLRNQRPGAKTTDYFHLLFDYGALQVILHSSCLVKEPGPHFQIHGNRGSFVKYGMDPQEAALLRGERPGPANPNWGKEAAEWYGELTANTGGLEISKARIETLPGDYPGFYRQLAASLTGNGPVPVLATEAAKNIELIEKAIQSSQERRTILLAG